MRNIYVLVTYARKPKQPRFSNKPGYILDENNVSHDEKLLISTKIKPNDYAMCSIILDMKNQKVVKNSISPGKTYSELLGYYSETHEEYFLAVLKELMPGIDDANVQSV